MKTRVLLGFVSYGPYHLARLKVCREMLPEWEMLGWELSSNQSEYGWRHAGGNEVCSVTTEPLESLNAWQWLTQVWRHLDALDPSVCVLAGYGHPGMLAAMAWCRSRGRRAVIMSDSKVDDAPRKAWVEWFKGRLLKSYAAALVAGAPHRDYFIRLGFPQERIRTGYDVVDNAAYAEPQPAPPMENPYWLVVSRFVPKKNLPLLLAAYAQYQKNIGLDKPWTLVICGDGPLREELEAQIKSLNLTPHVKLLGFLQMDELQPYLAHAQALIHASVQEQWGLVVNEAMAAGLPVVVSRACGCYTDLVQDEVNGFGFDPMSRRDLTNLLVKLHWMSAEDRKAMGAKGQRRIEETHSLGHFATSLKDCVELAMAQKDSD